MSFSISGFSEIFLSKEKISEVVAKQLVSNYMTKISEITWSQKSDILPLYGANMIEIS
ncbi:22535_t:CDS:1, partial [Rhizophagus irregularis]